MEAPTSHTASRGVVLGGVAYGDRSRIVKVLTQAEGLVPLWVANARQHKALWHPMAAIELAGLRPGRGQGLWQFQECRRFQPQLKLASSPARAAVAFFIAEVLSATLEEQAPAPEVFGLAWDMIQALEQAEEVGWIHMGFMSRLVQTLGMMPSDPGHPGMWLSLENGEFVTAEEAPQAAMSPAVSHALMTIHGMEFAQVGNLKLDKQQRKELVLGAYQYIQRQLGRTRELKSYDVLETLFS
ncbi:MAG: DNA repair protein RecO C-terminal domain-containing protein [Bacteroidetes bacterium]|jgi:DNA repair protein RecO|nr:DNA repair protein RecO C-terminal domain-containing protein [Bacteroidota bacterium]